MSDPHRDADSGLRKGWLKYRNTVEQAGTFLSIFIIFLSLIFFTRKRELLLKEQIILGLGAVLNVFISMELSLREKWIYAGIAMAIAVAAVLLLGVSIYTGIG